MHLNQCDVNRRNQSPQSKKIDGQGPFRLPGLSTFPGTSVLRSKALSQTPRTLATSPGHLSLSRQRKVWENLSISRLLKPLSQTRLEILRKSKGRAQCSTLKQDLPRASYLCTMLHFAADRELAPQGGGQGRYSSYPLPLPP